MKKRTAIIFLIIMIIIIISIIIYYLLTPNKLYAKYQKQDEYNCNKDICETNNQSLDEKYIYSNKIDTNKKTYEFEVSNKEKTFLYTAKYQQDKDTMEINYKIDDIEWIGNYYINNNYISLKPNCDECNIEEETMQNYRDQIYIESSNITNSILNIIKK